MDGGDTLKRFLFERFPVRGHFVRLDASWRAMIEHHQYPEVIRQALGETAAAALLLAATVKVDGRLTLQLQGPGPMHLLVVQAHPGFSLRGVARWKGDLPASGATLRELAGEGQIVATFENDDRTSRYQGVVPVEADLEDFYGPEAVIEQLPGYAGSRPVRVGNAAQGQVQLDVFGPVADLIADLATYRGGGPLALHEHEWRLLCQMVDAVQRRWAEPDAGIWEIRDTPRHHVYSRVMCWLTVHRAIEVAESMGRSQDGWATLRDTIAADVIEKGFDPTRGVYVSAYDRMEIDASALSIGTSGLLAADDPRFLVVNLKCRPEVDGDPFFAEFFDGDLIDDDGVWKPDIFDPAYPHLHWAAGKRARVEACELYVLK